MTNITYNLSPYYEYNQNCAVSLESQVCLSWIFFLKTCMFLKSVHETARTLINIHFYLLKYYQSV